MNWNVRIFHTGYCTSHASIAAKGLKHRTIKFYALIALLEHPKHGKILFDTGYSKRFFELTTKWPEKLYAQLTPVFHQEGQSAAELVRTAGVDPKEISKIIISHFHADHVCGLKDFPNATFVCTQTAWQDLLGRRGFQAVKKGYLMDLLPMDFSDRLYPIQTQSFSQIHPILGGEHDLFGDGSLLLNLLPGHAAGQMGMRTGMNTPTEFFFCADAAWLRANYADLRLPLPIVRLFFDSWREFKISLQKIHTFHRTHPHVHIIPSHCEATLKNWTQNEL